MGKTAKSITSLALILTLILTCLPTTMAAPVIYPKDERFVAPYGNDKNDGTIDRPWATVGLSVAKLKPGQTLFLREGRYLERLKLNNLSGVGGQIITVAAYPGETAIIDGAGSGTCIEMTNCEYITIDSLTLTNADNGIVFYSNAKRGNVPLRDITFRNNNIFGIISLYGIGVRASNYLAPVTNMLIEGNRVHGNRTHHSESVVLDGNVNGFVIRDNTIYNNNNIAIDMTGFYGLAVNGSDVSRDRVRQGKVYRNLVFGSNTNNNDAYWTNNSALPFGGQYDNCCDGIYVDGGSFIEIYNNFIFDCDIGIEAASEHKASGSYFMTDINVHDNVIASSNGWSSLAIGGYKEGLAPTVNSRFENNILFGGQTAIALSVSEGNIIQNNIVVGGENALEPLVTKKNNVTTNYAHKNSIGANYWHNYDNETEYYASMEDTLAAAQLSSQVRSSRPLLRAPLRGDFTPINVPQGIGSLFLPNASQASLYASYVNAAAQAKAATAYLEQQIFDFDEALAAGNLNTYLTGKLKKAGFADARIMYVLRTGAGANAANADGAGAAAITTLTIGSSNGNINATQFAAVKSGLTAPKNFAYMVQVAIDYEQGSYTQSLTKDRGVMMRLSPGGRVAGQGKSKKS